MAELASTAQDPSRDFIRATPRNPVLGYLSDLAGSSYSPERTQQMQGVAQFFGAPAISQTLNRMAYGEPLTTGAGGIGGTSRLRPEVAEAAMSVMDFLPTSGVTKGAAMAAPLAVGMLAGKKAATWDALAAVKAKMLADMGTDARTIWSKTGTWKGPDGKWRQEIDGSSPFTPSINPQAGAMLRDQPANLDVSKVMNNFKVPKTLYHGSAKPFESFDPKLLGTNTKSSDAEIGFHFSNNKADASLYADMAKRQQLRRDEPWLSESDVQFESGVVRPFNLDIKNPLVIGVDESEGNAGKFTQQFLDDKLAARKYADENGYDGIIYPHGTNVDSGYTVIAFEPSQIKEQVVNQPTNK